MRHRANPPDHHEHRGSKGRDQHELQQQVAQLKRVIRVQNSLIVALSSCFLVVILSTLVLIQLLPHPHDEGRPFWEAGRTGAPRRQPSHLQQREGGVQRKQQVVPTHCSPYGCPIRPVELSQLDGTSHEFIASSDRILLTHKSNRQKPAPVNQDRAVLIPSFGEDYKKTEGNFFVGLFDGHDDNGHDVAQYASEKIPMLIAFKMQNITHHTHSTIFEESMKQIITQSFVEVDNDVPITGGGCTAVAVMRRGSKLYMANTGDSTAYIVIYRPPPQVLGQKGQANVEYVHSPRSPDVQLHLQGTVSIHHQNVKHKANLPEEHERIKSLGGRVHIPPQNPNGSRVIVRSAAHREDVGLAMSRSIGDWEWTAVGVIPDPDVVTVDLVKFWSENAISRTDKVFVVVGSDGLFDARRVEFVSNHLAFGLAESRYSMPAEALVNNLVDVGKKLVNMASPVKEEWYRDDITFVAKVIECDYCMNEGT